MCLRHRAAAYLLKIPVKYWADHAFPACRYGQRTSNLVEQQNNVYREAREKPILDMLQHIWDDAMGKRFRRAEKAQGALGYLSEWASSKRREEQDNSRAYRSHHSSATAGRVYSSMDARDEAIVTLIDGCRGSCTCKSFQNELRPCAHAWALLDNLRLDATPFFAAFYTRLEWIATYCQLLPPILLSELVANPTVLPPKVKVQRGRAQTKRNEAGMRGLSQREDPDAQGLPKRKRKRQQQPTAELTVQSVTESPTPVAVQRTRGSGIWGGRWEYVAESDLAQTESVLCARPRR